MIKLSSSISSVKNSVLCSLLQNDPLSKKKKKKKEWMWKGTMRSLALTVYAIHIALLHTCTGVLISCFWRLLYTTCCGGVYLSHCCDKIHRQKALRRGRLCFDSQFKAVESIMIESACPWELEADGQTVSTGSREWEQEVEPAFNSSGSSPVTHFL